MAGHGSRPGRSPFFYVHVRDPEFSFPLSENDKTTLQNFPQRQL
jgi:hypothetical protein